MIEATGRDAIREALQEMFRDAFHPSRAAIGSITAMLSSAKVKIVHLGHSEAAIVAVCGAEIDVSEHVTVEHNEITCPLCYSIHEAVCALGDDETPYFGWDIDSILETDAFMNEMIERISARLMTL